MKEYNEKVGAEILTENLKDVFSRAEIGDTLAARDALEDLVMELSTSINKNLKTGEVYPVPEYMRDYLARSLVRIIQGEDANRALNLKKSGKKKWGHFEKRLAANLVFRLVADGKAVLEATMEAADIINDGISKMPEPLAWRAFKDKKVSGELLSTWYYELKDELTKIHQQPD